MIENSFSILGGIGEKMERRLWSSGVLKWEDFLDAEDLGFISAGRKRLHDEKIRLHSRRLTERDAGHFSSALKKSEHWRLFDRFRDEAVCLDIETNGYAAVDGGYVTTVGLYDGHDYKCLVRGEDLDAGILSEELSRYKYLITFYGSVFDVPFLKHTMDGFSLDIPHFDLCFGAKKVGLRGGLKKIETTLGIERVEETRGMDGYEAVLLWNLHRRGKSGALEKLIKYNREDTVNLWDIAATVYERLRLATGIERYTGNGRYE